jgi:hypothetical protein
MVSSCSVSTFLMRTRRVLALSKPTCTHKTHHPVRCCVARQLLLLAACQRRRRLHNTAHLEGDVLPPRHAVAAVVCCRGLHWHHVQEHALRAVRHLQLPRGVRVVAHITRAGIEPAHAGHTHAHVGGMRLRRRRTCRIPRRHGATAAATHDQHLRPAHTRTSGRRLCPRLPGWAQSAAQGGPAHHAGCVRSIAWPPVRMGHAA